MGRGLKEKGCGEEERHEEHNIWNSCASLESMRPLLPSSSFPTSPLPQILQGRPEVLTQAPPRSRNHLVSRRLRDLRLRFSLVSLLFLGLSLGLFLSVSGFVLQFLSLWICLCFCMNLPILYWYWLEKEGFLYLFFYYSLYISFHIVFRWWKCY